MNPSRINLPASTGAKAFAPEATSRVQDTPQGRSASDKAADLLAQSPRALLDQNDDLTWRPGLVPPQPESRDDDAKKSTSSDRAMLRHALAALMAGQRLSAGDGESQNLLQATQFMALIDALYLSPTGENVWGGLSPDALIWPDNFAFVGQELGLFSPSEDVRQTLRALSLANPPLRVPAVVITQADAAAQGLLAKHGLARGQAFQVVGTYRDGEGEAHLLLSRGDSIGMLERHTSVPVSLLGDILSHIIIGDARIERALRDVEAEYAKLPIDRSCCMYVASSAGLSQTPRAACAELPRGGNKCWTCPHAHALCQPHRS